MTNPATPDGSSYGSPVTSYGAVQGHQEQGGVPGRGCSIDSMVFILATYNLTVA